MSDSSKPKIVLYVATPVQAHVMRERMKPVKGKLELAALAKFGTESADDSLKTIQGVMASKGSNWVVFHLPTATKALGSAKFLDMIKKLIRNRLTDNVPTYIIDPDETMNEAGRKSFEGFGVHVVNDEREIGDVFAEILGVGEHELAKAGEEDPLFQGIVDDGPRLPGMQPTTPSKIDKGDQDPFAGLEAARAGEDEDPFASMPIEDYGGDDVLPPDPFANDPFASPATSPFAPAGPGAVSPFGNDLFASDPFAAPAPVDSAFDQWDASPNAGRSDLFTSDPFEDVTPFDESIFDDAIPQGRGMDGADFNGMPGNFDAYPEEEYEDYDEYPEYGEYSEYNDFAEGENLEGFDGGGMPNMGPVHMTVEQLLERYGDALPDDQYRKMESLMEPNWDYIMEHEDGIGNNGGALALFKGKKKKRGISQVGENTLANSVYMAEVAAEEGYYSPPDECKIITTYSCKGGPGKSLVNSQVITLFDHREQRVVEKTVGDVEIGDKVFAPDGTLATVLEVHDQPEKLRVYEIELLDGRVIECSSDHIWSVLKRGTNKYKDRIIQKTTAELMEKPIMKNNQNGHGEYRWKIPQGEAVQFPEADLPIPPYVLGALIGDGYTASNNNVTYISSSDDQILEEIEKELGGIYYVEKKSKDNDHDYTWVFRLTHKMPDDFVDIKQRLRDLDLACTTMGKFIPDIYKYASIEQRKALLQGLMDTDGTATKGRFSFFTINARLRDDMMWLARSLGYICSYSLDYRPDKYTNSGGKCWRVSIQTNDDSIFRLLRKQESFQQYKAKQTKVEILPLHNEPTVYADCQNPPLDPYLYGIITGHSQKKAIMVRCSSDYVIKNVIDTLPADVKLTPRFSPTQADLYQISGTGGGSTPNPIREALRKLGEGERYSKTDGINDVYLKSSVENRKRLLQGMLDAHWTWTSKGFPAYRPMSDAMREDFIMLVESLGYEWFVDPVKNSEGLIVLNTRDVTIFGDEEKREQMYDWLLATGRLDGRSQMERDNAFVSIKEIRETDRYEDMRCLYVDHPSHMFMAGDFVSTHNTTVSVMLATQLNWYFNAELMQNMTTSINARVLLLSLNEFDDIPTHGIGYDEYYAEENDNDGKNITELLRRIDETGGEPMWDDISYCFVSTQANRVFYLPSLTQKEQVQGNIVVSAADYKKVINICSRFFQFIVMDSPDLFYNEKSDVMNFAFSISDIICFVIEADTRSTVHLFHFFDGLRGDTNKFPLDANKCLCVVNKYVSNDNPYTQVPLGQIKFEKIATSMSKYFARFVAIPFTQPRAYGNVLDGTDPKIKYASAELADDVLEMIDYNDSVDEAKKKQKQMR